MAKTPEGPFEYKGVIVSNGDLGYKGNTCPVNYTGNNHGGLEVIDGKAYIFWHRQTHGTSFSRQGCADKVEILSDGTIPQIEITSCGLNNGPLPAAHHYDTYIACHLTEGVLSQVTNVVMGGPGQPLPSIPKEWPYITEEACAEGEHGLKPYIFNMRENAIAGFKYFEFLGHESKMSVEVRGKGTIDALLDSPDGSKVCSWTIDCDGWINSITDVSIEAGVHALYFVVRSGCIDFASFEIQ